MNFKKLNINIRTVYWIIVSIPCLLSCNWQPQKKLRNTREGQPDTSFVIGIATQHLFDTGYFPKEFADTNMMVIKSDTLPFSRKFKFCGKESIFVKPEALTDSILMQVMNPKPFVELIRFDVTDNNYSIGLRFKTVGKKFDVLLRKESPNKYYVDKVDETEF